MCVIAIMIYSYFSLKTQMLHRIHEAHKVWREKEFKPALDELAEAARHEAEDRLQKWREHELEAIRKQQLETARSEATFQLEQWKSEREQAIRQDAIQRSQSVTVGKVTEHIVPYLPNFTYNPKDARFIGSPIDLIVFDGLNDGEVRNVIFVEIKTGVSTLSARERRVRDAIQAGKVLWVELRPTLDLNQPAIIEDE